MLKTTFIFYGFYTTVVYVKLAQPPISDFERNFHAKIRDKMRSINLPHPKSRGALLMDLAHEMKELKEELEDSKLLIFQYT